MLMSYWKNINTGVVYKYEVGVLPLNVAEWKQISSWEYDQYIAGIKNGNK